MKVNKLLVEKWLDRDTVKSLTDSWFAIQRAKKDEVILPGSTLFGTLEELSKKLNTYTEFDGSKNMKMNEQTKRVEYDKLYDSATDEIFDNVKNRSIGYDELKRYMRGAWLKLGFEAGDGNDDSVTCAVDMAGKTHKDGPIDKLVSYIIENYNAVDDYLNDDELRYALSQRSDLWTDYTAEDISRIIRSLSKIIESNPDGKSDVLSNFGKADNLRDYMKQSPNKGSGTIKVNKINNKSSEEDIAAVMKDTGILNNQDTIKAARKILDNPPQ